MQLIVLGMHRSGTSMVARLLNMMGAYFGAEGSSTGFSAENPKGFWERRDIRNLNDRALFAVNADWYKVADFDVTKLPDHVKEEYTKTAKTLIHELDTHRPWVIKEPRFCLLFPILRPLLEIPVCVHVYRNPLQVAQSLKTRNGFPIHFGIALWEKYNLSALSITQGLPNLLVSYSQLIEQPVETVQLLFEDLNSLGVQGLRCPNDKEIQAFIDPALFRERDDAHLMDEEFLNRAQIKLFKAFEERSVFNFEVIPPLSVGALKALKDYQVQEDKATKLRESLAEKKEEAQILQAGINERDEALKKRDEELTDIQRDLAESKESEARQKEEIERLQSETREQSQDIKQLIRWIEQLDHDIEAILKSRCWRFGNAIGELGRRVIFKSRVPMATDHLEKIRGKIREWKKSFKKNNIAKQLSLSCHLIRKEDQISSLKEKLSKAHSQGAVQKTTILSDQNSSSEYKHNKKRKRYVVYTAISNNYDKLRYPKFIPKNFDFVCFSDQDVPGFGLWEIRKFDYYHSDPTRTARFVKIHPHLYFHDYEVSIWIDSNLLVTGDLNEFVETLGESGKCAGFIHPHRQCIYDEAEEIIRRGGLDTKDVVEQHVSKYKNLNYPEKNGLIETNALVRKHGDPEVIAAMKSWWRELENGSKRDQLSLNFVLHQTGLICLPLAKRGISVRNDPRIERFQHGEKSSYILPKGLDVLKKQSPVLDPFGKAISLAKKIQFPSYLDKITIDIIVCIHNSLEDVKKCINSVYPKMSLKHRLILVDDGSDLETKTYLDQFEKKKSSVKLIRREEPSGYTKAANIGVRKSNANYVILLNSDTIVPKNWLKKLVFIGEACKDAGIIGPMSNAASWQSLPEILTPEGRLAVNKLPSGLSVDEVDKFLEEISFSIFPRVPLINGFCFCVKREVLDTIGLFDEEHFPKGYGEENDFCFRANNAGFSSFVATNCYIFHAKSKSYTSTDRDKLAAGGSKAFRKKYPRHRIDSAIESTQKNPLLCKMRKRFQEKIGSFTKKTSFSGYAKEELKLLWNPNLKIGDGSEVSFFDLSPEQLLANQKIIKSFQKRPHLEPNRVLWFIPAFNHILRGGIRTIFATAEQFSKTWGTQNYIVIFGKKPNMKIIKGMIKSHFKELIFEGILLKDGTDPNSLPESDAAICTLWTSAFLLVKYNLCKAKYYFVQDFEPSFYAAGATFGLVQQTYEFGFIGIANTKGVAEKYRTFNPQVDYFTPGVDHKVFFPSSKKNPNRPLRIVFYGRPNNPRNAFHLGIESLKKVKQRFGSDVQIISVGGDFSCREYSVQNVIENHSTLKTMEEVAALYRSSDIGLVFMFSAHPSYQPFEFMASGCATVTNYNPYNTWFYRNNDNVVLTESMPSAVAYHIQHLLEDQAFRQKIISGGFETVKNLSWEKAFERIQKFFINPKPANSPFLEI